MLDQQRETAQRRQDDERRAAAEAEQHKRQQEAAIRPQPVAVPPEQACKSEGETLAKLRVSRQPQDIVRFERDLKCDKLRLQVVRLRESVVVEGSRGTTDVLEPTKADGPPVPADDERQAGIGVQRRWKPARRPRKGAPCA